MSLKVVAILCVVSMIIGAIVTKMYSSTEKEEVKDKIVTVIKEHKNSDGSSDTETRTVENKKDTTTTNVIPSSWLATGLYDFKSYGVQVQRRILGPVWAGGYVKTNGEFGLAVSIEF